MATESVAAPSNVIPFSRVARHAAEASRIHRGSYDGDGPSDDEPPPGLLCNVWITAATMVINSLDGRPQAVMIDSNGELIGIPSGTPAFGEALVSPGYVCMVDRKSDVRRIAARIRAAAVAVEPRL